MASWLSRIWRWPTLAVAVFASLSFAFAVTGFVPQPPFPDAGEPGPLSAGQALWFVILTWTALLGFLAERLPGRFVLRVAFLFVLLFTVNCALSVVEAALFLVGTHLAAMNVVAMFVNGVVSAALIALCTAALVRPMVSRPTPVRSARPTWPVIVYYIAAYYAAGLLIAWPVAAVRSYYENGVHIPLAGMAALQILRAAAWLAITLLGVRSLRGSRSSLALVVGASYAAFMALPLLIPGPLMPWPVRVTHLVEICCTNLLFGVVAWFWLTTQPDIGRSPDASRPVSLPMERPSRRR